MSGPGSNRRPSFRLARSGGGEEIAIPAGRAGGHLLALAVCVVVWPIAVFLKFAFIAAAAGTSVFLIVAAIALVLVVAFVLLQIGWWLAGVEWIGAAGGDLRIRHTILGLPLSSRSYRGAEIRFLAPIDLAPTSGWLREPSLPFLGSTRRGSLKFFHRGRTVYLGHDLDPADAGAVVAWLSLRLPSGTVDRVQ